MGRSSTWFSVLFTVSCGLSLIAGCGTEGGADLPLGGTGGDGGTAGTPGAGGSGGAGASGGAAGVGGGAGIGGMGGFAGGSGTGGSLGIHPPGYTIPDAHGSDLRLGELDCRVCHGSDLTGNPPAPSCDTCHTPSEPLAWRSDCVFCHGGVENDTGAPPRNLDGSSASAGSAFPVHDAHVGTSLTTELDCVECHVKAVDVLSVGHVFDDTPGIAEVDLGGGRSPRGTYDQATGCTSLYCHGNGQGDNGSLAATDPPMTCESCHAGESSPTVELDAMSGRHSLHLSNGAGCKDCHQATTADGVTIAMPSLHINGQRDHAFSAPGFSYDPSAQTCTGTCHTYVHTGRPWIGAGGGVHAVGFVDPNVHGPEMELQRMDCRTCHGADLTGGAGPSCDGCHTAAGHPNWDTDCVFCHGGDDNDTGAPPRDLGALPMSGSQAFLAHTVHVTEGISQAYDCRECHIEPVDVLSAGHAFDDTPGMGEVTFSMGLSAVGTYDGVGTCSGLYCHGDGQGDDGSAVDGGPAMDCDSCHADMTGPELAWQAMSGKHRKHLSNGVHCGDCHLDVTSNGTSILNPLLHVDGALQLRFSDTALTYDAGRCSGECHGERHQGQLW